MLARRWRVPVVVLALIGIAFGAAIAIDRSKAVGDGDIQAGRVVVNRYLDAYRRHDGRAICATLMPSVREQIAGRDASGSCTRNLERISRIPETDPPSQPRATLRPARDGDGISVLLEWPSGSAVGMRLQRVDGAWLLDSDQSCITPSCRP